MSSNDENMVLIAGNPEVADVHFTEYARLCQHFYALQWAMRMAGGGGDDADFLNEGPGSQRVHWTNATKRRRRELFSAGVAGNQP